MNIGELILKALLKELETNPDRIFALLSSVIALLEKHPELLTTLIGLLQKKNS